MGSAALIAETVRQLQRRDPEKLKEILSSDEWLGIALRAFKTRLENAERDAVRIYFEQYGLIEGDMNRALAQWLAAQGVESAQVAQAMIELAKRAMDSSERDAYRLAKELVRARVMADPDERRRAMQEIFGQMEIPARLVP
jgi:hypothetical protein